MATATNTKGRIVTYLLVFFVGFVAGGYMFGYLEDRATYGP
jgi:hypothetical protein